MFKISRLSDYSVILLSLMAKMPDRIHSTVELAQRSSLPQPVVGKILKLLTKGKIIASKRGINGGYLLSRATHTISIAEVIAAIDGPVNITSCIDGVENPCHAKSLCPLSGRWQILNNVIEAAVYSVSLADIIEPEEQAYFPPFPNHESYIHE